MSEKLEPMLAPYRVLDLTNEVGFLCGRFLGDLGADVIKIEKPGGDPARNIGPFYHDDPDPEKSLYWFFYNANKRGITLNIEAFEGKEIFQKLVKKADIVIESFPPGYMDSLGLGYSALSRINPRVIMTSITPFGQSGPYSQYKGSDIVVTALSGWMNKCGDPDRAPLQMGVPQAYFHGSAQATQATLMALYHRSVSGEGQQIDASPLPWMSHFAQPVRWYVTKMNEGRHGQYWEWSGRPLVRYVWECKDGSVCYGVMGGPVFARSHRELVAWMDSEGMAPDYLKAIDWNTLDFGTISEETRNSIEEPFVQFFKQKTKAEIFEESLKRDIVLCPASTASEMLENDQLANRDYWVKVKHPELKTDITYPGAFFRSDATSWQMKFRAPLIGEHNEEIYAGELGFSREELAALKKNNII